MKNMRRVFDILLIVIMFFEFIGAGFFCMQLYAEPKPVYDYCQTESEVVENTNEAVMDYWGSYNGDFGTVLVSPVAVQTALYKHYNSIGIEDVNLFAGFDNGYKNWQNSGVEDQSFSLYYPESQEALLEELGECVYTEGCIYAVCRIDEKLKNGVVYGGKIYVTGAGAFENGDVVMDLGEDYEVFLGGYHMEKPIKTVDLCIEPFIWQAHGTQAGLLNILGALDYPVRAFSEFGFRLNDYESVDNIEFNGVDFSENYEIYIRNKNTGVLIAIGRR